LTFYQVGPAKFISSQHPALILVLQSITAKKFGLLLKHFRKTTCLQQAQQKAQAFFADHSQEPAGVEPICVQQPMQ
jgi:hypothetical protein